jgi:hypothetical protein
MYHIDELLDWMREREDAYILYRTRTERGAIVDLTLGDLRALSAIRKLHNDADTRRGNGNES